MRSVARDQAVPRRAIRPAAPSRAHPDRADPARTLGNRATARLLGEALSSPGQPLDLPTRRLMEPHLGYDLRGVRVHHGPAAAESAAAVDALAYAVGSDIVFGAGQYRPGTDQGKALLAHELTHVVQQRNVRAGTIRLGDPSDDAERRTDVLDTEPTLRRAIKVDTWAGSFVADPYELTEVVGTRGVTPGYGVNIGITFTPNALVDAEQISFVQTATSTKDGVPHNKYEKEKEKKVAESRMIPAGAPGAGAHIDQFPDSATPLYPGTPGWRYRDAKGVVQTQAATMKDSPDLNTGYNDIAVSDVQTGEWSQRFETTALATAGKQRGAYYGSVQWGWTKSPSDTEHRPLDFKVASKAVPTPTFMASARLWNDSKTTAGTTPAEVPIAAARKVAARTTQLWDGPGKGVKVAMLPKGTEVEHTEIRPMGFVPSLSWFWTRITVSGGRHAGKTGWVWDTDLSPRP